MAKYLQGQLIVLKSDKNIEGAIMQVIDASPETRYQFFTASGPQIYYESQLEPKVDVSLPLDQRNAHIAV